MICVINKNYKFKVTSRGTYTGSGECVYDRRLSLPIELVNGYAIDANMGIELILNELVYKTNGIISTNVPEEIVKIFPDVEVKGSMDFEPKGYSGETLATSELLITTKFTDDFYNDLVLEINTVFRINLYVASMVLVRKLFENLIIDCLREKYGEQPLNKALYFSMNNKRFLNFQTLINNFESHVDDFKAHNVNFQWDKGKNDFFKFLRDIKERGDACAHSIELIHNPNKIIDLKPSINKYSDLLVRLYQKVRESPK